MRLVISNDMHSFIGFEGWSDRAPRGVESSYAWLLNVFVDERVARIEIAVPEFAITRESLGRSN